MTTRDHRPAGPTTTQRAPPRACCKRTDSRPCCTIEVNSVERDGENGATWEVEVTKPDGSTVDVRLDESYGLVVVEGDDEDADSDSG